MPEQQHAPATEWACPVPSSPEPPGAMQPVHVKAKATLRLLPAGKKTIGSLCDNAKPLTWVRAWGQAWLHSDLHTALYASSTSTGTCLRMAGAHLPQLLCQCLHCHADRPVHLQERSWGIAPRGRPAVDHAAVLRGSGWRVRHCCRQPHLLQPGKHLRRPFWHWLHVPVRMLCPEGCLYPACSAAALSLFINCLLSLSLSCHTILPVPDAGSVPPATASACRATYAAPRAKSVPTTRMGEA